MRRHFKTASLWLLFLFIGLTLFSSAARKPFWFRSIFTLRLAQCHQGPEMWHALTAGVEFNPPGIYVATRWSEMVFGRGPMSSRLPSILSGLIVLFCAFQVASRRFGTSAGYWALFLSVLQPRILLF